MTDHRPTDQNLNPSLEPPAETQDSGHSTPRRGDPIVRLALVLIAAVVIGAVLSPAITWGLLSVPPEATVLGRPQNVAAYTARKGHASVFSRVVMVCAVVGLALSWRQLPLAQPAAMGLPLPPAAWQWRDAVAGLAVAVTAITAMLVVKWAVGELVWELDRRWVGRLAAALATAVFVGSLEEVIFRGVIFTGLARRWPMAAAVIAVNVVYSASHCLNALRAEQKAAITVGGPLDVGASWACVVAFATGWAADPVGVGLKFATLAMFGGLATWATLARGHLMMAMGLHIGAVFTLQADGAFRALSPTYDHAGRAWLLGGKHLEASVAGLGAMALAAILMAVWMRFVPPPRPGPAGAA